MPRSISRELRVVVQHVPRHTGSAYRLIAYGDGRDYYPIEFECLDTLVKTLNSVLPDFDIQSISKGSDTGTSIVFSSVLLLTESEVSRLGLAIR
jgi:hypothetical protein